MDLYSNESQKSGTLVRTSLSCDLYVTFFVLTIFQHHLQSITEQMYSNRESNCLFVYKQHIRQLILNNNVACQMATVKCNDYQIYIISTYQMSLLGHL